jgi:predicted RNase H-like HicB family nuclease
MTNIATSNSESDYNPAFRCHLAIIREEEGDFSVLILNLPGVGSCGNTENEAIANTREAIAGALESYVESGEEIPWADASAYSIPQGAKQTWVDLRICRTVG